MGPILQGQLKERSWLLRIRGLSLGHAVFASLPEIPRDRDRGGTEVC